MRFGFIHRLMTNLLAVLGVLSLVTSGELGRITSVMILVGTALAVVMPERWQTHRLANRIATIVPLGLLIVQIARMVMGAALLQVAVEFAIALQITRLATRRGAAHDQQVIVLAWLHLIAGTVLGGGLAYGLCFLGFLVVAPGALVLSHLRREVEGNYRQGARDRTGLPVDVPRILRSRRVIGKTFLALTCLLSLPIFLFTATLFIAFPRVGLSLLLLNRPTSGRMVGFSDHVDLGGVGTLRTDPTIVLRVEIPDLPTPPPERISLYLRGTALDAYDGIAWSRTRISRTPAERIGNTVPVLRYPSPASDPFMKFDLEPIDPPVIFLPPNTAAIQIRPRGEPLYGGKIEVLHGAEDEYRYVTPDTRGITYEAFLTGSQEKHRQFLSPEQRKPYLALPKLSSRVATLGSDWTQGLESSLAKAQAIEIKLKEQFAYDLNSPSGAADDPLDHFLFESRKGHCEYFSTAMAVLLREVGVPTRNITGFVGGTYNRFGAYYSVRQGDAHSWVEAYTEESGWLRFDPTPASGAQSLMATTGYLATLRDFFEAMGKTWDQRVVRYDLHQQIWLFSGMRRGLFKARNQFDSVALQLNQKPKESVWLGTVTLLALGTGTAVLVIWLRRRKRTIQGMPHRLLPPEAREATELYLALQREMALHGMTRSPGTPPLKHALRLLSENHPCAHIVEEVTLSYLAARFGDQPLTPQEHGRLSALIRTLRVSAADSSVRTV